MERLSSMIVARSKRRSSSARDPNSPISLGIAAATAEDRILEDDGDLRSWRGPACARKKKDVPATQETVPGLQVNYTPPLVRTNCYILQQVTKIRRAIVHRDNAWLVHFRQK
jgi:hypothetical protein